MIKKHKDGFCSEGSKQPLALRLPFPSVESLLQSKNQKKKWARHVRVTFTPQVQNDTMTRTHITPILSSPLSLRAVAFSQVPYIPSLKKRHGMLDSL